MTDILRVGPDSTRADLVRAIETLRGRQRQLGPGMDEAYEDLDVEIAGLVEQINDLDARLR